MRPFGRTLFAISAFRACLGVLVAVCFDPTDTLASIMCIAAFCLAQFSDQIDGWIARRWSEPTLSGYLEDSVSDKLFHIGCLLGIARIFEPVGIFVWLVCLREFSIMAARTLTPNLTLALRHFKRQSVLYALFLRLGIVAFLLLPLFNYNSETLEIAQYGPLILAILAGIYNIRSLSMWIKQDELQQ